MIEINIHKTLDGASGKLELKVDLEIKKGDFVALYGPSGAGKTSLLRIISGLDNPNEGKIVSNGFVWFSSAQKINIAPHLRKIGFVFQDYALFPNMTVRKNLEYALQKSHSKSIVDELIDVLELKALLERKPDTLSGGQKQRISLARALVQQPEVLLLDEPLSALNYEMRLKLQDYILKIHKRFQLTTIIVSHDLAEIFKLTNKVIQIEEGKIIAYDKPERVFNQKKTSGKYSSPGKIIAIKKTDTVCVVDILSEQTILQVVITQNEADELQIGDVVLVVSKAFNPILIKV